MSGLGLISIGLLILLSVPIVLTDLKERRIPNAWNLALAATGLLLDWIRAPKPMTLLVAALDFAGALGLFLGLVMLMRLMKKPTALGMGDVKFLAAASLWIGFTGSAIVFVLASLLALVVALAEAPWKGLDLKSPRPFGPMLAASLLALTVVVDLGRQRA
jgi:leader peptidase (prepilin peptidase)/N-methyltransferase